MPLTNPVADIDPTTICPPDYGLLAWNWDPAGSSTTLTTRLNTAGRLNVFRVPVPVPITCTNIVIMVTAAGATLTSGQCFAALYDPANVLVAQTATQHTAWTTTGQKNMALASGPFNLRAGQYDVGIWYNGTTAPGLLRHQDAADLNMLTAPVARQTLSNNTGLTTTAPASVGTKSSSGTIPFWVGLS